MTDADADPPIPPRDDTQPLPIPPAIHGGPPTHGGPAHSGQAAGGAPAADGASPAAGADTPLPGMPPPPGGPPLDPGAAPPPPAVPRRPAAIAAAVAVTALTVLLAALVVVNATVARNAETRAADEAEAAFGAPVDVRLGGFPVGLRLLLGAPVDARLVARDVPLDGTAAVLTRLEVTADAVTLERGGDGAIHAEEARFVAELDDDAVQQLIGIIGRLPLTDIELANGVARLSVARFALVDATADIENGQVVFRVTAPIANLVSVRLELDDLPLGFVADDVEIRRGVLRLHGSATDIRLDGTAGQLR